MSTLQTLRDAFTELERRADTMTPTPGEQTGNASQPTRRPWARRTLAPLAAAVAVAAILAGGIIARTSLWPADTEQPAASPVTEQPAASTAPDAITVWQVETASCPAEPAQQAAAGAILRFHDSCVRLVDLAATFTSPVQAKVTTTSDGNWAVNVTFNEQQTAAFTRATTSAVGHQLALVGGGQVLSAAIVGEPILNGKLTIAGISEDEAHAVADILNNP